MDPLDLLRSVEILFCRIRFVVIRVRLDPVLLGGSKVRDPTEAVNAVGVCKQPDLFMVSLNGGIVAQWKSP